MLKNTNIIRNITCLLCLFFLVYGCTDKKSESEPVKTVVSKKISVPSQKAPAVKPETPAKQIKPAVVPEKPVKKEESEIAMTEDGRTIPAAPALAQTNILAKVAIGYDPKGKIDPFIPLIKDEPQKGAVVATKKVERKKRIPTTPLERIELSQLRLRAVVRSASGNKALVEESSGKGYIITKGTFIGVNQGTVVEIQKDKIIVEEEIENLEGDITVKKRELRLPKPPGEE